LVEIMVAITVLALVATVVFSGLSQMMRNKERVEASLERSHVIRSALERMARELSMAFVSTHVPRAGTATVATCFIGQSRLGGTRLDFTSFSHHRLYRDAHESDQNELSYFVTTDPEDSDKKVLARREQRRIDDDPQHGGRVEVLVPDIERFELEYLDSVTGEWTDSWDSTGTASQPNRLPIQIKIRLTVRASTGRRLTYATRAAPQITWALNHANYRNR
jgi:general secretion pathway protein J